MAKNITAYKALNHEFKCNNFSFEVGKTYVHEGQIKICNQGFHACENPLDVLDYYPLVDDEGKLSRFARVTQSGEIQTEKNKTCSARITIECEISFSDFVKESVSKLFLLIKKIDKKDDSKLAASGNCSKLAASGDDSKLAASGYNSQLAASGKRGVIVSAERDCYVKGATGTLVCLCLYDKDNKPVKLVTGKIGENDLKPDVWYALDSSGAFVERNP